MTKYIVFVAAHSDDPGKGWIDVGQAVEASSDIAAIKSVAKNNPEIDMSHGAVAVPSRSWRPRKPEHKVRETTTWK